MTVRGNDRAAEACGLGDRKPGVRLCRFDDDVFGDAGAHYWDSRTGGRVRAAEVDETYTPEQPCPEACARALRRREPLMDTPAAVLDKILPEGWDHNARTFGFDFTLVCPHGHAIEADGKCPEGCRSPLVERGLI